MDSSGNFYLIVSDNYDGFALYKYDSSGNSIWARSPYQGLKCNSIYIDKKENIWLSGSHSEDYGPDIVYPYVWKYDSSGVLMEALYETSHVEGNNVSGDKFNHYYISGSFSDSQIFGNTTLYASQGNYFLAKLNKNYPKANFSFQNPLCENQSIIFLNSSLDASDFLWQFPGGSPAVSSSDTTVEVIFNAPGEYLIKLIAVNDTFSDTITKIIDVFPKPDIPIITQRSDTLFSSYSSSNQWWFNNDFITLATEEYYQITSDGNYLVQYTDTNGCFSISQPYYVSLQGIFVQLKKETLDVYPNPFHENFIIVDETNLPNRITIYNTLGEVAFSEIINSPNSKINFSLFPKGLYVLKIESGVQRSLKVIISQ